MKREYIDIDVVLDTTDVEMLKDSDFSDREFLNKLLEMVFTKNELQTSSAKGLASHGKSHKPLNQERLLFVERKIISFHIVCNYLK